MKKLIRIFILFAAACLVNNSTEAKILDAGSVLRSAVTQVADTLDSNKLIRVDPFRLDIIPPSSGVQFYRDGIVFLSHSKSEGRMLENHTSFGTVEAYYAVYKDTVMENHTLFSHSFSWEFPCEAMTFNSDYSLMYYTKLPTNNEPEKIYQAKYQVSKKGKHEWISDTKPLNFCNDESVYAHPALSADGEKMVFVSNRKESIGELDLFISYKEGSDWSSPINLGNVINTSGNEMFPFLDQDNNLFFSSDGLKGLGGYDIYVCWYNGRGWDKPVNLTRRINTPDDDLAFKLNRLDGKSAFFTTRADTDNISPRLFRVTFLNQYALTKLTNLTNAFRYIAQAGLTTSAIETPATEKVAEVIKPDKEPVNEPVQNQKPAEIKQEPATLPLVEPSVALGAIVYRVQFLSSSKPKGSNQITIGGQAYKTYEYLFNGAYRSCAGEFSTSAPATNLQNVMRRQGYPDAFVVAFRNNVRLTESIESLAKSQKLPEIKQEQAKPPVEEATTNINAVIYRVQFSANPKPKGSYLVTVGGKAYRTFEYLYSGAYRSCVGEFSTRELATNLQSVMRREGYADAFIAAFKNNVRITDPALLK
jgi:hypothetical protein